MHGRLELHGFLLTLKWVAGVCLKDENRKWIKHAWSFVSRKCDKLESDDFRNDMKYEFELICKVLNESKMLWLVLLLLHYSWPQVYGRTGRMMEVEESGREKKEERDKRSRNQLLTVDPSSESSLWISHWKQNLTFIFEPEENNNNVLQIKVLYKYIWIYELWCHCISKSSVIPLLLLVVK